MRQLNVHKIVKNLNKLCIILNNEYNINCGGCCYIAYEIAKHLDRFHINYKLHIFNDISLNQEGINREVRNKRQEHGFNSVSGNNTCCHYYLVVKGGGPVNKGNFNSYCYSYVITKINHRNLNWLYRTGKWNPIYKRVNNKVIKKIINSYFKQYGKIYKNNLHICKNG